MVEGKLIETSGNNAAQTGGIAGENCLGFEQRYVGEARLMARWALGGGDGRQ